MHGSTKVAIIGGGPAGLLTALILARAGVACSVFERHAGTSTHPKAMGITRRTAEIFRQLGLHEVIAAHNLPAAEFELTIWAASLTGEIYGRTALPASDPTASPCDPLHCPQTFTEETLLDALEREPAASIYFDHEVTAVREVSTGVELHVSRPGLTKPLLFTADWTVAADGAASPIRQSLGIETDGPGDQGHFLNVYFRAAYGTHLTGRRAILSNLLTTELFETFVAVNGTDLWLMHHFLQPGESPPDYPNEKLREIVQYASGLPAVPVEILSVSPWIMSPKVARSFRSGRIFLTGDAAARLSPAGGLGMNTGLQSAHNLAWKLAAVVHGAPKSLLTSYESERIGAARANFARSDGFRDEVFRAISAGLAGDFATVREIVGHSRRADSGLQSDLGWAYEKGAFIPAEPQPPSSNHPTESPAFHPTCLPGTRAPHCWITRDDERISTLDLFGRGFVLLTSGSPDPWATVDGLTLPGQLHLTVSSAPELTTANLLPPNAAILVRPDGVIAWRCDATPASPADAITSAVSEMFNPAG